MGCGSSKSSNKDKPTRKPKTEQAKTKQAPPERKTEKEGTEKKHDADSQKQADDARDEDLDYFDNESIVSGYPPPKPARKDLTFPAGYFDDVDLTAETVPDSSLSSFKSLQRSLFDGADNDAKKVRAILAWYCSLNIDLKEFPQTVNDKSPRYYLKRIQDGELLLEEFFTLFCREAIRTNMEESENQQNQSHKSVEEDHDVQECHVGPVGPLNIDNANEVVKDVMAPISSTDPTNIAHSTDSLDVKIGVPCVMIYGDVKGASYEVGDADVSGKTFWAAAYVNSDWRLVQPCWATSCLVGYDKGGKILVDDSTKITAERQEEAAGINISLLNDYYIFTPAHQLINDCFPEKKEWQLLKSPLSLKDFIGAPKLEPTFFTDDFSFKKKTVGVQKSKNGMCNIAIKPPDIKTTTMRSNLFFHERKSNRSWEEALDYGQKITPDRFVFKNRDLVKGEMEFEVRFPATGIYQLELCGGTNNNDVEICSFRLDCDSIMDDCKPYPEVPPMGYGPGPETFQAGLKPRSHKTGRVIARVRQLVRINFVKVVEDAHKTKQYKSDLKSDNDTIVESKTWVSESADKNNYNIEVNPQKSGEYILAVSAKDTNQHDDMYENICNYLIDVRKTKKEKNVRKSKKKKNNKLNRLAKDNLRRALISTDIERIERALKKFEDRNMEDKEGLAEQARQRIEYLKLRNGLHDAIDGQNIKQLKAAISKAKRSDYKDQLEPSIQHAKDELERLKNGGDNDGSRRNIPHPTPPLDARTLLEIKRYNNPSKPVRETMIAFLLILGEKPQTLTDWKTMKKPLREEGDKGVLNRAWKLDVRQVPKATLKDSKKILSKYNIHSIRENSVSVAAFYDWTKEVIRITEKAQKKKKKKTNKVQPASENN